MEPHLPHEIMYRPKMGFSVPLARWFRGPLRERVREAVRGGTLAETGYFNAAALQQMLRDHDSGLRDYSHPLWTVLMFDAFLRSAGQHADVGQPLLRRERRAERVAV
jgi:asparagine synthase (glutamine-hydrolysing)